MTLIPAAPVVTVRRKANDHVKKHRSEREFNVNKDKLHLNAFIPLHPFLDESFSVSVSLESGQKCRLVINFCYLCTDRIWQFFFSGSVGNGLKLQHLKCIPIIVIVPLLHDVCLKNHIWDWVTQRTSGLYCCLTKQEGHGSHPCWFDCFFCPPTAGFGSSPTVGS